MKFTQNQIARYKRIKRLEQMQKMDPVDFEHFTGWLYQRDGYTVGDTVVTGDEGIDLDLKKRGRKTIVQCKRYSGTVGQPTVRDLYGAMFHTGAKEAHLVTTGKISRQAENWAAGKPIELIDGHDLVAWVNRNRRETKERQGARIVWWTVGGLALFLFMAMVVTAVGGWLYFNSRTTSGTGTPLITIPTRPGSELTTTPEDIDGEVVENLTPTPALAATATLNNGREIPVVASKNVNIPRRTGAAPTIDGSVQEWDGGVAATSSIRVYSRNDWDGTDDSEADWRFQWDEQYLYLVVHVTDNIHVQTESGASTYLGDSLEVQFDTEREKDYEPSVSPDDYQIELSPGDFGAIPAEAIRFRGDGNNTLPEAPGHNIIVASKRTNDGYILEARIPWADIGVTPSQSLVLGANFNVNDNDTPNSARQEAMYSNIGTRSYRNPTTWGTVTLIEE